MATDFSKYQAKTVTTPTTTDFSKYGSSVGEVTQPVKNKSFSDSIWSSIADVGIGAAKGGANTLQNIGNVVLKPVDTGLNAIGLKTPQRGFTQEQLQPTNTAQKIGKFGEQVAEFAIPESKIGKVAEGANLVQKAINIGSKALSSGAVATAQEGEVGTGTGIAAGTELLSPVLGKVISPVTNIFGRLFKGLGSELSGASTDTLNAIIKDPQTSKNVAKQIVDSGQETVLENNAKQIVEGVSKIRKEASQAFGESLQTLKSTDIQPKTFRNSIQNIFDKYDISSKGNERFFGNVEFEAPSNIQKASNLIDELSKTPLDGYSLRKLLNKIDNSQFKIATSDERLAFNAFINDLSKGVKTAINDSTDKLKDINSKYSQDIQLSEAIQKIFGKVKFKNESEINAVARKLEGLFSQKGLDPKTVDDFLTRVGISPSGFRASEATRQITNKSMGANQVGTSISEMIRGVTSAIVTPKTIRDVAIYTGLSEQALKPILERLSPVARGTFIKSLINEGQ